VGLEKRVSIPGAARLCVERIRLTGSQKQTLQSGLAMSALPPKADIEATLRDLR